MTFKNKIRQWAQNDWLMALLLLLIFLFIKGYKYNWDDQHLEIPLLKSLIDKTLYRGDYYVESLKLNLVTYFYPLLAHLITLKQIPLSYFILYLISKYFLFLWAYKLWSFIAKEKSTAFLCVLVFISFGRVPEFLYRTFSHQEFTLAIVFAGLYCFYRERFVLASATLGAASNFHFLYSLFPMIYLGAYLLLDLKKHGLKTLWKSLITFFIFALPILIWIAKRNLPSYFDDQIHAPIDWISLYKIACPQNFLFFGITFKYMLTNFKAWFAVTQGYILLLALYILNVAHNEKFKTDKKIHSISLAIFLLLAVTYFFTYLKPHRLIIDLNLVRNTQFLFFLLMGYTTILVVRLFDTEEISLSYAVAIMFGLLVLNDSLAILAVAFLTLLLLLKRLRLIDKSGLRRILGTAIGGCLFIFAVMIGWLIFNAQRLAQGVSIIVLVTASCVYLFLRFRKPQKHILLLQRLFIVIPLIMLFLYYGHYRFNRVTLEKKGGGFWKLQRDWEDMQRFVQAHTPRDARLLVPHDMEMGGFRILSERTIVCCYRDCGIIGFDYQAAVEWLKRWRDIEPFKISLEGDINDSVAKAILKYKVNYIVFMRYYAPKDEASHSLEKVYENGSFSLFKLRVPLMPSPA